MYTYKYLTKKGEHRHSVAVAMPRSPQNSVNLGGVLPFMGHIGMCCCEGYGFQVVYSSIGYINQSFWV